MSRPLPRCACHGTGPHGRGFTLIELMIAIAVVAILAVLAYPALADAVRKSRRSEAFAALTAVQQAQERRRANVAAYTTRLDDLRQAASTPHGSYAIAIDAADATGYTVTASATGAQAGDERCATLQLQVVGGHIHYGSACRSCAMASPPTDPHRCWGRP